MKTQKSTTFATKKLEQKYTIDKNYRKAQDHCLYNDK